MLVQQLYRQRAVRWQRWALVACCVPFIAGPFLLFNDLIAQLQRRTNIAETSPYANDPHLNTQFFRQSPDVVFAAAVRVVQHTPFWHLTVQDPASRVIKAEVSVAFGLFTNDVLIHVDPASEGGAQVNLRASVRLSDGDRGMTVRQIVVFYHRIVWALANG